MKNFVISLIPAKGKSSKIKKKNFLKIKHKTLLEIAIINSKKCKKINETFVSSESEKIKKIAKIYHCKIINRPSYLSKNKVKGIEVIRHFCKNLDKKYKKKNPIIIILQPTSPLRTIKDLNKSIELFKKKKIKVLISVKKNKYSPFKDMLIKKNKLISITNPNNIMENRQNFPDTYKPNGAIFIFYLKEIMKKKFTFQNAYPYLMDDISSIDIDTYDDFKLSKKYFKKIHGKFI